MGRSLVSVLLLLPLLFSAGHAAPFFHGLRNFVMPHDSTSMEVAAVPDHHSAHGRDRMTSSTVKDAGAGEINDDHSKTSVDAGTKGWPFVYYTRRDRQGTLDWGTNSWPYVYYSKKINGRDDMEEASSVDAGGVSANNYGRKAGHGFML